MNSSILLSIWFATFGAPLEGTPESVRALSPAAKEALGVLLDDAQPAKKRRAAARKLEHLGESGIAYALCAALPSEDGAPKRTIVRLLDSVGAARLFVQDLGSKDPAVRALAARSAACVKDERLDAPLVAALDDPVADVRSGAADSLARRGATGAGRPLLRMLRQDADPSVRAAAAQALGELRVECEGLRAAGEVEQDDFTRILIDQAVERCSR